MRKFNIMSLLLAVVGVLTFASCQHKYADYTPGAKDANMGVYFPAAGNISCDVSADTENVIVKVARLVTEGAASVSLRASLDNGSEFFTINGVAFEEGALKTDVSFADGEAEADVIIAFDGTALETGVYYPIALQLDAAQASNYAISEITAAVGIPEPWVAMGQGIYFDDFLAYMFADPAPFIGVGTYVNFEQHELEPNRIRVVDPFNTSTMAAMLGGLPDWLTFLSSETTYLEFDVSDPANVKMESNPYPLQLVMNDYYLCLYIAVNEETGEYVAPIVLEDGIIKFPTTGVQLGAYDPNSGGYLGYFGKANSSGYMQYYLPGTEFVNYSIEAVYDGMYVSADGATAKGIFNFFLGADVASYNFAFVPGDVTADSAAYIAAVAEGSEDLVIFESPADTKRWEVELTQGSYTLVAVPFTAEGEARVEDAFVNAFWFNGSGEMPEVEVAVELGIPSELVAPEKAEEVAAAKPGCFNIGVKITADASQLKAIKYWYGNGESVDKAGITMDQLFNDYGGDASVWLTSLAEGGSVVGSFNVVAGSTATVFLRFETIYGNNIDFRSEPYTLPAYDGDMYIGQYAFQDGEGENVSQQVFGIVPGKSYNDFFFTVPNIDGSTWYATYDAAAGTMSVAGFEYGYEQYGNQFGGIYGYFDADGTMVYGYFSSVTADFADPTTPIVFSVVDNKLAALQTYYAMNVFDYDSASQDVGDMVGSYFLFTPTTQITTYSAAEPAVKAMSASRGKAASFACGDAQVAGAGVKAERVIKATPIVGVDYTPATLKH